MATYVNDLRLKEIATGDESGTWGTSTNTNLELIAEAFSYSTVATFDTDADKTETIADGSTDPYRSIYVKVTSGVSLTATRTLTIAPNTVSKIFMIENATSGSQSISISQGSGANVTIPNGDVKVIYTDGAGAGAAVVDAFASLNIGDLTATNIAGTLTTAAQTNITSVGTLSSLTVSGDATFDTSTLKVDSTNNRVGIGTTSPDQLLHISAAADTAIRIENTDTTATSGQTIGKIEFEGQDASTNASGVRALIDAQYAGVGGQGRLKFQLAQENSASLSDSLLLNYGTQQFFTSGSEAMRIDSSGNVGIGTTSPNYVLNTNYNANATFTNAASDFTQMWQNSGTNALGVALADDSTARFVTNNGYEIAFNNASTESMRIDSSGNVSIGNTNNFDFRFISQALSTTTTPAKSVLVRNGSARTVANQGAQIGFQPNSDFTTGSILGAFINAIETTGAATNAVDLTFGTGSGGSAAERMRIDASGRLAVGISSSAGGVATFFGTGTGAEAKVQIEGEGGADPFVNFLVNNTTHWSVGARDSDSDKFMIANNSDLSSGVALTIDTSENVGIGTSSPVSIGGHTGVLTLFGSNATALVLQNSTSSSRIAQLGSDLAFFNNTYETERMRLTSTGLGIGLTSPSVPLEVAGNIKVNAGNGSGFVLNSTSTTGIFRQNSNDLGFTVGGSERMRIDSGGDVLIGTTADIDVGSSTDTGHYLTPAGAAVHFRDGNTALYIGRQTNDGDLVSFRQAGSQEGTISVSGATVSYNGFSGTHESSGISTDIEVGTVVSTIDELDTYTTGSKAGQTRADHAKIKVSDVEGDARVYGVLSKFDENNKPVVASVGIGPVKVTGACNGGDLLESNGDGTAKVQSDDIIRSKTIGKVTIGNSDAGVKLVSCVLYCG